MSLVWRNGLAAWGREAMRETARTGGWLLVRLLMCSDGSTGSWDLVGWSSSLHSPA